MAANEYYQPNSQQVHSSLRPGPYIHNVYSNPSYAASEAPSYHSDDPRDNSYTSHHRPAPGLGQQDSYIDDIPLKSTTQLSTDPNKWSKQPSSATYPPSPEAQQPDPELLNPKGTKRKFSKFLDRKKVPYFVYTMTLIQCTVFIVEIIKNSILTGSPIMIHPQFNPMIGPSTYLLINMGARFVPCMRTTYERGTNTPLPDSPWPCPNTTTSDPSSPSNQCTLTQLCGLGGLDYNHPDQWYRFITPIFLHAGIIHIGFNMMLQLTLGRDMEKAIGTMRFAFVYLSSGIFGFAMGGNFAPTGIASTGASGCLFGILALTLLDLLYTWQQRESPVKELLWLMVDVVISFVLGLLPGLDNFSHIGGFLMGIVTGICLLHSPASLRQRIGKDAYRYVGSESNIALASGAVNDDPKSNKKHASSATKAADAKRANLTKFAKEPVGFFKGRKPLWWAWWLIRAGALIGVLIGFVVLLTNFYRYRDQCSWCKYLSCLDITVNGQNWCDLGYITFQNTTSTNKRDLFDLAQAMTLH